MSGVYFTFFPYLFFSPSSPFSLFFGIFMFRCFCKPSRSICRGKFIARVLKDTAKSMTLLFVDTLFRLCYGFVIFTRFNLLTPLTLCYTSQAKFIRLIYECTIYIYMYYIYNTICIFYIFFHFMRVLCSFAPLHFPQMSKYPHFLLVCFSHIFT